MPRYLNLFIISIFLICFSISTVFAVDNSVFYKNKQKFLPLEEAFNINLETTSNKKEVNLVLSNEPGYYLYKSKIKVKTSPLLSIELDLPEGKKKQDEFFGEQEVYYGQVRALISLSNSPSKTQKFIIEYQGCSEEGLCYPPSSKTIAYKEFSNNNLNTSSETYSIIDKLSSQNFITTLFGFFFAGILLALTPCVLPMVPILSGIILAANPKKSISYTLSYVGGISFTYTLLGITAGVTGTLLSSSLQNVNFLIFSSIIYLIFALSMFDFIKVPSSPLQNIISKYLNNFKANNLLNIFLLGLFSSLILSPCVAPPLAAAILYIGKTQDYALGGLALFSMSIGMSLPLLIIGFSSQKILPKAGPWMSSVKRVLGFILFGMSIYIIRPLLSENLFVALLLLVLTANFVYLLIYSKNSLIIRSIFILCLIFSSLFTLHSLKKLIFVQDSTDKYSQMSLEFTKVNSITELNYHTNGAINKPILLDFYADWCVACLEYEKFTFSDPKVAGLMRKFILLQADVTSNTNEHSLLLKKFDLFGPPGIIFFDSKGKEVKYLRTIGFKDSSEFSILLEEALKNE
jgi:thiol:disulfide interchange protein DsbD